MNSCEFYWIAAILLPFVFAQISQHVKQIAQLDDDIQFKCALDNILKPRVVGSPGHKEVREYIVKELQSIGFAVELDEFSAKTPIFKNLTFSNIIGRSNPKADSNVVIACHYDSKYFPNNPNFVGAIDSAVPCAILLNIIKVLQPYFQKTNVNANTGLMLIFFDGEETFLNWNEQDSLYGSRHLARKMANNVYQLKDSNTIIRDIDRIEVFILLDLIGAANPQFFNFYQRTQPYHSRLVDIERSLQKANLLNGNRFMFYQKTAFNQIGDDHEPFYDENVPILHLICTPFPRQWHTKYDDATNLHFPSIKNFIRVFRVFVYEYLFLDDRKLNLRAIDELF